MKVYVGDFDPPGHIYTSSDMNGDGITVTWYCDATSACYNSWLSCKGDGINTCYMESYSGSNAIDSATLECNIPNESCVMDCWNGCTNSNLLCHRDSSGLQCDCRSCGNGVTIINDATYQPTTPPPSTATPTNAPSTPFPITVQPTTSSPTTTQPTTGQPTTGQPTTRQPTTGQPTTRQPTTGQPTTGQPTTGQPTTRQPTTSAPVTAVPTTAVPTTTAPTTSAPTTTLIVTTDVPTTNEVNTASPTSISPTTVHPSTPNLDVGTKTTLHDGKVNDNSTSSNSDPPASKTQDSGSAKLETMTLLYIIIAALSGLLIIGGIAFCIYYNKMKTRSRQSSKNANQEIELNIPQATTTNIWSNGGEKTMTGTGTGTGGESAIPQESLYKDGNETNSTGNMGSIDLSESDDDGCDAAMYDKAYITPGNGSFNGENNIDCIERVNSGTDDEDDSANDMYNINNDDNDDIVVQPTPGNINNENNDGSDDDTNKMYNDEFRQQTIGK